MCDVATQDDDPVQVHRRPRERGEPVSFDAKSLDSRFRGNDTRGKARRLSGY